MPVMRWLKNSTMKICILKKGEPVFYGTVEQAKSESGCEKFEDAYLQLSGEEDAA